jgi:effector-binding domain-containing protein
MPFMIRGMMLVMNAKASIEADYEEGLSNLKTYVESKPAFKPMSEQTEDMWYVGSMGMNLSMEDLDGGNAHSTGYDAIGQFLGENGIQMAGAPMSIVHRFTEESMDLEFAIPVADSVAVPENLTIGKIPGGKILYTMHYGPYNTVESSWNAISEYVEGNNIEVRWLPMEVYTNDPTTVEETMIETKIIFPVAE